MFADQIARGAWPPTIQAIYEVLCHFLIRGAEADARFALVGNREPGSRKVRLLELNRWLQVGEALRCKVVDFYRSAVALFQKVCKSFHEQKLRALESICPTKIGRGADSGNNPQLT